jgi:hypothetical protein
VKKIKIKEYAFICAIIGIMIYFFLDSQVEPAVRPDNMLTPIEQVFQATGAQLEDVYVDGWVRLEEQEMTLEQLKTIAFAAVKDLSDAESNIQIQMSSGTYHSTVRAQGETKTRDVMATAQIIRPSDSQPGKAEVFLVIHVEEKGITIDIGNIEKRMQEILRKNGGQTSITTCLSGWVSGKLEEEKMQRITRQAFHVINARITEGVSSPQFVSYAGITSSIDRSVKVGKNLINLNVAMRHNSTEERTYVTAATPIITLEY